MPIHKRLAINLLLRGGQKGPPSGLIGLTEILNARPNTCSLHAKYRDAQEAWFWICLLGCYSQGAQMFLSPECSERVTGFCLILLYENGNLKKLFFKNNPVQPHNGVLPISKLPFPNRSYRNVVCR